MNHCITSSLHLHTFLRHHYRINSYSTIPLHRPQRLLLSIPTTLHIQNVCARDRRREALRAISMPKAKRPQYCVTETRGRAWAFSQDPPRLHHQRSGNSKKFWPQKQISGYIAFQIKCIATLQPRISFYSVMTLTSCTTCLGSWNRCNNDAHSPPRIFFALLLPIINPPVLFSPQNTLFCASRGPSMLTFKFVYVAELDSAKPSTQLRAIQNNPTGALIIFIQIIHLIFEFPICATPPLHVHTYHTALEGKNPCGGANTFLCSPLPKIADLGASRSCSPPVHLWLLDSCSSMPIPTF